MKKVWHLVYHYVRDENAPGPTCTPERLRKQIAALKSGGYEIMTCGEVAKRLIENHPLPEKHATLSFDDGLKDQYTIALPILKEFGVPATFFYITCALDGMLPPVIGFQILIELLDAFRLEREILPEIFQGTPYVDLLDPRRYDASGRKMGEEPQVRRIKWMFNHWAPPSLQREMLDVMFEKYVGKGMQERFARERFMSGENLRTLADAGMEIGSHTVAHPALDITGIADIEQELALSRRRLAMEIGRPVSSFAWTFGGKFRPTARQIAGKYYASAWNFCPKLNEVPESAYNDLTDIPRLHQQVFQPE